MTMEAVARPRTFRIAWTPFIWILGLHLGAVLALAPQFFTWKALAVCLVLHWLTGGIGICMTYHRLLTHRSFAVRPKWLEYLLTIVGTCASEGGAIHWVSDHRRHHAHSDDEDDVHSPVHGGFGWAHMFWWMTPDITSEHSPAYHAPMGPRPGQRPGPRLARPLAHPLPDRHSGPALCHRRNAVPGLGLLRPVDPGAAHDLARQLGDPRLGLPDPRDARFLDESLVGGPPDLRRRVAQQPPRLPDLGPTRPGLVGGRHDLPGDQGPLPGSAWRTRSSCRRSAPRRTPEEAALGKSKVKVGSPSGQAEAAPEGEAAGRRGEVTEWRRSPSLCDERTDRARFRLRAGRPDRNS